MNNGKTDYKPRKGVTRGYDKHREAKKRWRKPREQQELLLFVWCLEKSRHI